MTDLIENWYQGVIWVAEYEFEVKILNFQMADLIWRPYILKNSMSWRIWMENGTRGLFGSLNINLRLNISIRYVFSHPKKSSIPILIEIRQFFRFFQILIFHIGSAISKFQILTSNSYSATQITPWYQFPSKSANSCIFQNSWSPYWISHFEFWPRTRIQQPK